MQRKYLLHSTLFGCAYVGFLALFYLGTDRHVPTAPGKIAGTTVYARVVDTVQRWRPGERVTASQADSAVGVNRLTASSDPITAATVSEENLQAQYAQEQAEYTAELSLQASGSGDGQQRAVAIDQLGDVATPEVLNALAIAATTDQVVRNRIRAINSLQRLAGHGRDKTAVLSILERAMTDQNPGVASRAKSVYEEFTASRPTDAASETPIE